MPKVLISDSLDPIAENIFKKNNIHTDIKTSLSEDKIIAIINNYDGLVVRSATKVTSRIIESATNLKVIGRAGAGVDNIDLESSKKKKIIVMNTPGGNTNATAEHTLGLLISLYKNIYEANKSTHQGLWEKKKFKGLELRGKSVGIIGFGNVGVRFSEICISLGMKVSVFSKSFDSRKNNYPNIKSETLDSLLKNCDIISFHCKAPKDGQPIISIKEFNLMKKNSVILNTARGNLINENDLKIAVSEKLIKGAALDVFSEEPAKNNILFNIPNIILTPHIAASTIEAQIIVAEKIAIQISDYLNNGIIKNAV